MTVNLEPIANMLRGEAKLRTHSGKVLPGDIFVTLSSLRTDGARFIDEAVTSNEMFFKICLPENDLFIFTNSSFICFPPHEI